MTLSLTRYFKISLLGLVVLLAGCHHQPTATDNLEAPAVISEMSKHGIIEQPKQWSALVKQTNHGKNVKTVRELSAILQQGNRHSFATDSPKALEQLNYPSISNVSGHQVLNVPTFFSADSKKTNKYQQQLRKLLKTVSHQQTLILNFAHNQGGDYYPMIAGLAAIIPKGVLWSEVDNAGHGKQVVMTATQIHGGLLGNSYRFPASHAAIHKQVVVITDSRTGSAAEMTIMALKRNPQVTTIGVPTAGYTSVNKGRVAKSKKTAAILTIGTITSPVKIGNQRHFNNEPLKPDLTTMYAPISPAKGEQYQKQQPLDTDFWHELEKHLSE